MRSAIETLAILIYLNQLTKKVIDGSLEWSLFSEKTETLLSGSRDGSTAHTATNIITIFQKCDKAYPGIERLYGMLSESAHPNYEGMRVAYSETDTKEFVTYFKNRTQEMYSGDLVSGLLLAMRIFEEEYNNVWSKAFEDLERWLEANDGNLSAKTQDGEQDS